MQTILASAMASNERIIEAHVRGIVTSASLMVRLQAACEAASYVRLNRKLSVGLHFDFADHARIAAGGLSGCVVLRLLRATVEWARAMGSARGAVENLQ
jgi:predicted glycoside hydrolase/deacetylase ChbG (UPF0249 family)